MTDLPPDLAAFLGIKPEPAATAISPAIRAALRESRKSRGKTLRGIEKWT